MASKVAFIKQETNWFAIIQWVIVAGAYSVIFFNAGEKYFYLYGLFLSIITSYFLKRILLRNKMRTGVKLIKEGEFKNAIPHIEKDIHFLRTHQWIDKYRILLMLSSSKRSYLEILLSNKAYCLLQIENVEEAKKIYESMIKEYPENNIAPSMLRTINAIQTSADARA